jgi:hypothetical protein
MSGSRHRDVGIVVSNCNRNKNCPYLPSQGGSKIMAEKSQSGAN